MAAPKGNQFWKLIPTPGRKRIYETPEQLWEKAVEYFEWIDANPITKEIVTTGDYNKVVTETLRKPYQITGLILWLGVSWSQYQRYRDDENYKAFWPIVKELDGIIYAQKFEGASAGIFNPTFIARDLGLADVKDLKSTDGTMTPKEVITTMTPEQLKEALKK